MVLTDPYVSVYSSENTPSPSHTQSPDEKTDVLIKAPEMKNTVIKYASLVILTLQTSCLVLLMRVSRLPSSTTGYSISTVVVCAECSKLITCCIVVFITQGGIRSGLSLIYDQVILNYRDTIHVLIPSALYTVQNNLLYIAISNLNAVAYQILYQSKIFTTAFFMIVLMGRRLLKTQWMALFLLFIGIILSQKPDSKANSSESDHHTSSLIIGFMALLCASVSSGFAGVYFEKILKGTAPSVWMRNIQLALFGIPVGLFAVYTYDREAVAQYGFFHGYSLIVWLIVILQTCSGLGVAFVMKYADNILKGFAAGLSILLSSAVSYYLLGDFTPTITTFIGAALVIGATVLYGYEPKPKENVAV